MTDQQQKAEEQLKSYQQKELEFMKKEASIKEKEASLELKVQKEMLEARQAIEEKIRIEEKEKQSLKMKEYEKKMGDLTKQLEDAQRAAQQGSMQLQGEVQELALEEILRQAYVFDEIKEVPKGVKGADTIQIIRDEFQSECGTIVYESKRTKTFGGEWIEKLKYDQRLVGADVAVLVTETMPKNMTRFGQLHGVWVCTFGEVESLSFVLREMILKMQSLKVAQVNKGDKMEMLYDFLTGQEFGGQISAIVEGFMALREDLDREKRSMEGLWKRREKQIVKVIDSTAQMYGSIRGIAGKALPKVEQLELPESDEV